MMRKLVSALDSGVAYVTDLLRVEQFPLFIVKFIVKVNNELGMNEIKECVTNITIILKIK